jgi:hypothetical protein
MSINSFEQENLAPVVHLRPTTDATEVTFVNNPHEPGARSLSVPVERAAMVEAETSDNFFHLPALPKIPLPESIDESKLDKDTKEVLSFLSGLDRQESANDAATMLAAQVISDVYVSRRDDRATRSQARVFGARRIIETQLDKNQAEQTYAVEADRYNRRVQHQKGLEEDLWADQEALRQLRVEHKTLRSKRDATQKEYDGVRLRRSELALGRTKDGDEIQPLLDQERNLYITLGNQFGTLEGTDPGDYEPDSPAEYARVIAVMEVVYFPDYMQRLDDCRQKISELQPQIVALEEEIRVKETTSMQDATDRVREGYLAMDLAKAMHENSVSTHEQTVSLAHRIPGPPTEGLLEQAERELARRMGAMGISGAAAAQVQSTAAEHTLPVSGREGGRRIEEGGLLTRLRGAHVPLPMRKQD